MKFSISFIGLKRPEKKDLYTRIHDSMSLYNVPRNNNAI